MIFREVERPTIKDLFGIYNDKNNSRSYSDDLFAKMRLVGSGKGAIAIIFQYLQERKIIENKLDEVMVPDWLGFWIYNYIQPYAFPVKNISDRTKVMFVYHQYGFPQDMDAIMEFAKSRKLVVIEDCANALGSSYKGRQVGSFGDFSIYSFSKFVFCFALGGVASKFDDFDLYVQKAISKSPFGMTVIKDFAKFSSESAMHSGNDLMKRYAHLFLIMSYSIYGNALKPGRRAIYLAKNKIGHEIDLRKDRYKSFLEKTDHLGICDHLEREGVVPYIIPIRCSPDRIKIVVNKLRQIKIETGVYNFDINRNFLSPKFVPCIWIPCHGGIPDNIFQSMIEIISS